jgi:hypothetical protein
LCLQIITRRQWVLGVGAVNFGPGSSEHHRASQETPGPHYTYYDDLLAWDESQPIWVHPAEYLTGGGKYEADLAVTRDLNHTFKYVVPAMARMGWDLQLKGHDPVAPTVEVAFQNEHKVIGWTQGLMSDLARLICSAAHGAVSGPWSRPRAPVR